MSSTCPQGHVQPVGTRVCAVCGEPLAKAAPMQSAPARQKTSHRATSLSRPFLLTQAHDAILKAALYPYHLLTAQQITRLLYPTPKLGMLTTVQTRLKALNDAKYVTAFHLPTSQYRRPFVYCLGPSGRKYLEREGMDVRVYYSPSEQEAHSYGWQMHVLELNDFLIHTATLTAYHPQLRLVELQHDLLLKAQPLEYYDRQGHRKALVPDAIFELEQAHPGTRNRRYLVWVELDRGQHSNERFRQKLADIFAFVEQGYHIAYWGVQYLTVCYATTAGASRVERMRQLTRLELGENINPRSMPNQLFKFAAVPPLMQPQPLPSTVFCTPFWQMAYGEPHEREPLILPDPQ